MAGAEVLAQRTRRILRLAAIDMPHHFVMGSDHLALGLLGRGVRGGDRRLASGHFLTAQGYEKGALATGLEPNRENWGIVREIFVAETDEEAVRLCLEGGVGDFLTGYWLPVVKSVGLLGMYKTDPDMADAEVTPEFIIRNSAMIGSVDTVVERILSSVEAVGGFGTLLQLGADFSENPRALRTSMELLAREVMPEVNASVSASR